MKSKSIDPQISPRRYLAVVSVLLLAIVIAAWSGVLDLPGQRYTTEALTGATVTYGIARGLNAAISVAQGTMLDLQLLQIAVGEVLDPLNDMIERFSWLVMLAMASLGIQQLLLIMGGSTVFNLLLSVSCAFYLLTLCQPSLQFRSLARKLLILILFIRLIMPAVLLVNQWVDSSYLQPLKQQGNSQLQQARQQLEAIEISEPDATPSAAEQTTANGSLFDSAKDMWASVATRVSPREKLDRIAASVETSVEHVINLIVAFALQTLILPLIILWSGYRVLRWLLDL